MQTIHSLDQDAKAKAKEKGLNVQENALYHQCQALLENNQDAQRLFPLEPPLVNVETPTLNLCIATYTCWVFANTKGLP